VAAAVKTRRRTMCRLLVALTLAALWLGFLTAVAWWGSSLATVVDPRSLRFLPLRLCVWLVAGGMAVGSAGGYAAGRRA